MLKRQIHEPEAPRYHKKITTELDIRNRLCELSIHREQPFTALQFNNDAQNEKEPVMESFITELDSDCEDAMMDTFTPATPPFYSIIEEDDEDSMIKFRIPDLFLGKSSVSDFKPLRNTGNSMVLYKQPARVPISETDGPTITEIIENNEVTPNQSVLLLKNVETPHPSSTVVDEMDLD